MADKGLPDKMHVLIFIDQMSRVGGSERVVSNLCRAWADAGERVTLVTLSHDEAGIELPVSVVRRHLTAAAKRSGWPGFFDSVLNGFRLGRLVRELKPDVALAVSTVASLQLAFARCASGTLRFGSEHGFARHLGLPWHVRLARRLLYPRLDAVICPALASARALGEDCPGTRTAAVPNPLVMPLPGSGPAVPCVGLLRPGRRRFLTSARFEPLKRLDQLLEAFAGLKDRHPDWDLVLLGDGPMRQELQRQVRTLGLEERVIFPGMVGNPAEWYEACDLFVFSSHSEGFGMVLAEAMAHGLPCVSFDCDAGPADIIREGVDGHLVPTGDVAALADRMSGLAADVRRRAACSRSAREAADRFGVPVVMRAWRRLIEETAARRT